MPSCDRIKSKFVGSLSQSFKLQVTIAFNARVWGNATLVRVNIGLNHMLIEFIREVEDDMLNSDLLSNTPRIVDIRHTATSGVALATPQPHRHAYNLVTLFVQ
jgi:hypothetical protein